MRWPPQWAQVGVMLALFGVGACALPHHSAPRAVTTVATGCPAPAVGTTAAAALFCGYRPGAQTPCPAGPPPASRRTFGTLVTSFRLRDGTELRLGADLPPAIEGDVDEGLRALPPACDFPIAVVQRTWHAADSVTTATVLRVVEAVVADGGGVTTPRCLQSADGTRSSQAWMVGTDFLTVLKERRGFRAEPSARASSPAALIVKIGDEEAWWRRPGPRWLDDMSPVPCPATAAGVWPRKT